MPSQFAKFAAFFSIFALLSLAAVSAAEDGKVLWDFNTLRDFETVSGETASGGSMSGSGATVAHGMLYINSGYGIYEHMPGNVLLAFGLE